MTAKIQAGYTKPGNGYEREIKYLYQRLATVNNLIRRLEEYDMARPRPVQFKSTQKTACTPLFTAALRPTQPLRLVQRTALRLDGTFARFRCGRLAPMWA